jgi:hypothetical protein
MDPGLAVGLGLKQGRLGGLAWLARESHGAGSGPSQADRERLFAESKQRREPTSSVSWAVFGDDVLT